MTVPAAGETIATIRSYPDLVEAFRAIKNRLGLSNAWMDEVCGYAGGVTDKMLGPSHSKPINQLAFSMFCHVFAVQFEMRIDPEQLLKMEAQWEQREAGKVSVQKTRMGKALLQQAKPIVVKEYGRIGGMVTAHMRTPAQRSESARKAAKSRWRKVRKNRVRCSPEAV